MEAQGSVRNNFWHIGGSVYSNIAMAGPITLATESNEYTLWVEKLRNAGVRMGAA